MDRRILTFENGKYEKMKKTLLVLLLLSGSILTTTAKHKVRSKKKEVISVSVHRTACFGRCPDYEVKVNRDGLVTYTGHMFVKDSGIYEKNIGIASARMITDMCMNLRLDTCKDVYDNNVPDLPGLYYVISYKRGTKKIANASFGPGFLKEISYRIDDISKVDSTWKHVVITNAK